MPSIPRTLLIPAVGLALVLSLVAVVSHGARQTPEARLYREVAGYLKALHRGDPGAAARYREDGNPAVEVSRAEERRGGRWFLAGQRVVAAPRPEGHARVVWLSDEDRVLRDEVEIWRPGPEGRWRLWALDAAPAPKAVPNRLPGR